MKRLLSVAGREAARFFVLGSDVRDGRHMTNDGNTIEKKRLASRSSTVDAGDLGSVCQIRDAKGGPKPRQAG